MGRVLVAKGLTYGSNCFVTFVTSGSGHLVGEGSRVNSKEGDEVAAEQRELETHLSHVVRVHRQRLREKGLGDICKDFKVVHLR